MQVDASRQPGVRPIEIVGYRTIQFTKADNVLRGMDLDGLGKSEGALKELADKGMGPG